MKTMHFVDVYRHIDTSLPLKSAWLCDTDGEWALRVPVSREDSAEILLLKKEDQASIYDAISPSTLPFIAQLMGAVQVQPVSVEVRTLFERSFYATLTFQQGDRTFEIDGRIGLLLALALRFACPITIDEELLVRMGVRLPAGITVQQWLVEEQGNVYQKVSLPPQQSSGLAYLESLMRQAPEKPFTAEQQQQVREEIQQGLGPEQLKHLQQLYKNLSPEGIKRSKEMWSKLGFSSPPVPEEVWENDSKADPN